MARRAAVPVLIVFLAEVACQQAARAHPLSPLTAGEIAAAVRIFRTSGHAPESARFNFIALDEPPKEAVLRGAAVPRRAFAVIYDYATNRLGEAIADLSAERLASWKEIPGAQPPIGETDSTIADRIVRSDPRWAAALRARGIRDSTSVFTVAWPAGHFGLPNEDGDRIARVTPYLGSAGENYYAHPVEGIAAHVDLTTR